MTRPRIAVTGLGVVCAIGKTADEFSAALRAGRSGIAPVEGLDTLWAETSLGGEVKGFVAPELANTEIRLSRADAFAVTAAAEAFAQAGLDAEARRALRIGASIGTCQNALSEADDGTRTDRAQLAGAPADAVSIAFELHGPRSVATNACAAGGSAIAMARDQLWSGHADVMLAGGSDALAFFTYAGFSALHSLDLQPCSPYGRSDGLTLGEGAAIFVLESFEHALARGATILAELAGCGGSADGYHPTAPDPTGRGAVFAMRRALAQAGIGPDAVDYVNGHGTGTQANDSMERVAFRLALGERSAHVPISSTKSMIGHTLGAAGAIESAACVLAIRDGFLPPTMNAPDAVEDDFDFVRDVDRAATVRVAISNNYAFGGSNASIVWAAPDRVAPVPEPETKPNDVVITGLGAIGALGEGIESWIGALRDGASGIAPLDGSGPSGVDGVVGAEAPPLAAKGYASRGDWRKMNDFARMCVAATRLGLADADFKPAREDLDETALVLATATGPLRDTVAFEQAARRGADEATPNLFPHSAVNGAAGHVCTVLGMHGPVLSVSQTGVSSLVAFEYAAGLIARGELNVAIVLGADELCRATIDGVEDVPYLDLTSDTARPFDERADGIAFGTAAVAVVLESAAHAAARSATPYARVLATSNVGARNRADDPNAAADWRAAIDLALERAGVSRTDVGYCVAAAPGQPAIDGPELEALAECFGPGPVLTAPKSMTGECMGATAVINVLVAAHALRTGEVVPTANSEKPLPADVRLAHVATHEPVQCALAHAAAPGASYGVIVLGKVEA